MHANSTNANIGLGLNKETWVLSARVMVGAIVRPSRFWGCGACEMRVRRESCGTARDFADFRRAVPQRSKNALRAEGKERLYSAVLGLCHAG